MALKNGSKPFLARPATSGDPELIAVEKGAPSSLKKTSGGKDFGEGNYASTNKVSFIDHTRGDLGLTLLPGHQTPNVDENSGENENRRCKRNGTPHSHEAETSEQHQSKKAKRSSIGPFSISSRPGESQRLQQRSLSADNPLPPSFSVYSTPDLTSCSTTERSSTHASTPEESAERTSVTQSTRQTASKSRASAKKISKIARNLLEAYSKPITEGQAAAAPPTAPTLDPYYYTMSPAAYTEQMVGTRQVVLDDFLEPEVYRINETFDEYAVRVLGSKGHIESEDHLLSGQLLFFADFPLDNDALPKTSFEFAEGEDRHSVAQLPFFTDDPFGRFNYAQPSDAAVDVNFDPFSADIPTFEDGCWVEEGNP